MSSRRRLRVLQTSPEDLVASTVLSGSGLAYLASSSFASLCCGASESIESACLSRITLVDKCGDDPRSRGEAADELCCSSRYRVSRHVVFDHAYTLDSILLTDLRSY